MDESTLLEKLPKQTPIWAVGLVSIITSLTVSFVSIYFTTRAEFQQYLGNSYKQQDSRSSMQNEIVATVKTLTEESSNRLDLLLKQVFDIQDKNIKLTERIAALERELDRCQKDKH